MAAYLSALLVCMKPLNLLLIFAMVALGIVFGAIPGLSATLGIALLLPITFGLSTETSFVMLLAIWIGGVSGTFISAVLIGIPGSAALALIASMQSTDGGAALTRQLKDAGELTESETNTFAAFQMTADAPITNFFSSGAVLFTLVAADGTLAVPVSLGLCLGVILLGKVLSANMMRLLQIRASRK